MESGAANSQSTAKTLRRFKGQENYDPAEVQSRSNPRDGLLGLNARSASLYLASFSLSTSSNARLAGSISPKETSSLRRILFSSGFSGLRSSPLNARF